jgi:hypothetical protein
MLTVPGDRAPDWAQQTSVLGNNRTSGRQCQTVSPTAEHPHLAVALQINIAAIPSEATWYTGRLFFKNTILLRRPPLELVNYPLVVPKDVLLFMRDCCVETYDIWSSTGHPRRCLVLPCPIFVTSLSFQNSRIRYH